MITLRLLFLISIMLPSILARSFEWERVTAKDWDFKIPDTITIRHSAILFEKISTDDTRMFDKGCTYSIYKRLRIFKEEGRQYADVQVPIMDGDFEVVEIKGRVILKDNKVIELNDDHIFKKYVLESDDHEIEQTFFYLPGVTSDCIIEYYIEYEMDNPYPFWFFKKDNYLNYAELSWKFYTGRGMSDILYDLLRKSLVPNFVIINNIEEIKIDKIKDGDEVVEILLSVDSIPPFKMEDNIISPNALKSQVICFYQNAKESDIYWIGQSREIKEKFREERGENKKLAELKKVVPDSLNTNAKIEFTYNWILDNIINTENINDDKKYEENPNLDSLISRRYGISNDINNLFCQLLNAIDIEAYPVFAISREKNLFHPSAKYWQFDHQFTAIKRSSNAFDYYDLSNKNIPKGCLDYQFEGTYGYIIGCLPLTEIYIPPTSETSNTQMFFDNIEVSDDLKMRSSFKAKFTGHFASQINEQLDEIVESNKSLNSFFENDLSIRSVDTLYIKDQNSKTVSIEGNMEYAECMYNSGDFIVLNPFNFVGVYEEINPNTKREHPIQLDFPYNQKQVMQINLPNNLKIFKTPKEFVFKNPIGDCLAFITQISDHLFSVTYSFTLKQSIIEPKNYPDLVKLIEARKSILSKVILINKVN